MMDFHIQFYEHLLLKGCFSTWGLLNSTLSVVLQTPFQHGINGDIVSPLVEKEEASGEIFIVIQDKCGMHPFNEIRNCRNQAKLSPAVETQILRFRPLFHAHQILKIIKKTTRSTEAKQIQRNVWSHMMCNWTIK
jgi:hypothetical protein